MIPAARARAPAPVEVDLPELSGQRQYLVPGTCCLSPFVAGMDGTVTDVARPASGRAA